MAKDQFDLPARIAPPLECAVPKPFSLDLIGERLNRRMVKNGSRLKRVINDVCQRHIFVHGRYSPLVSDVPSSPLCSLAVSSLDMSRDRSFVTLAITWLCWAIVLFIATIVENCCKANPTVFRLE